MFRNLSPSAIGIQKPLPESIRFTKIGGFHGVEVNMSEVSQLAEDKSLGYVKGLFEEAGIRPGGWWLPFDWRGDEKTYEKGLTMLRRLARVASEIGCPRALTFVMPFSDDKVFEENFGIFPGLSQYSASYPKTVACSGWSS